MIHKKITILATDFKPMLGGVAEYTFQLAKKLNEKGFLNQVFTPNIQSDIYVFKVSAPQEFSWMNPLKHRSFIQRKLYSLLYICQLRWIELRQIWAWLRHRDQTFIIVNWIISPLGKRWICILHLLNLQYAIILHGKDIIHASQTDSYWFANVSVRAKLLIFNSEATATLFKELQPQIKTPYYILYPGIDVSYLRQYILSSIEELEKKFYCDLTGKTIISSVCRLVKRKGIDLAIRAIEPLAKRNKDLIFIIMGDGEEYQSLQILISSLELDQQVKLVGDLNDRDKFSLLNASSIFVMPNHGQNGNDFEGFGISFLEASYFKNVVIGGRSGGVTEAIKDGQSGFLVDTDSEYSVESIREIIIALLDNPDRMKQMAGFGHQYVIDNFQSSQIIKYFSHYMQDKFLFLAY